MVRSIWFVTKIGSLGLFWSTCLKTLEIRKKKDIKDTLLNTLFVNFRVRFTFTVKTINPKDRKILRKITSTSRLRGLTLLRVWSIIEMRPILRRSSVQFVIRAPTLPSDITRENALRLPFTVKGKL